VSSRSQFFHTYLGIFDPTGTNRSSLLNGSVGAIDGSWTATGGWFLPSASLPFVFAPPPLPNSVPAIAPQLPETLARDPLRLSQWGEEWSALPLQGFDVRAQGAKTAAELFDAALPNRFTSARFNSSARVTSLSLRTHAAHEPQFALQVTRVVENTLGGFSPISAGVLWGGDSETQVGPEGPEPDSDTFGQRMTVAGASAMLPLGAETTLHAELGRSWFAAQHFSAPGQPTLGGYYHLGVTRARGHHQISLDAYRFEPTYAPAILPYGNFVNTWPVAWSWPSNWLKGVYQLVDNGDASIDRQGVRLRYDGGGARLSYAAAAARFVQVTPFNATTALLPGFTDPFFTSREDAAVSYRGTQMQYLAHLQWNEPWLDVSFDVADDVLKRRAPASSPDQGVDLRVPETLLTFSHASGGAVYAAGAGRFAIAGCYALCGTTPVSIAQRVYFAGANFTISPHSSWLLEWRRYVTGGVPFAGFPFSPAYTGTRVIAEERFTL
jgi:hypothetical protein